MDMIHNQAPKRRPDLAVVRPLVIAITDPRTLKAPTLALVSLAGMCDRIMVSVFVLATAPQDPGALCHNVEKGGTGTSCHLTPASIISVDSPKSVQLLMLLLCCWASERQAKPTATSDSMRLGWPKLLPE